jgi:predicted signal transduction protein with EAL and GGDEF domain
MRRLSQPYAGAGRDLQLTPSIGIALYPEDGADIDALLSNADTAMYSVKENGRAGFRFFAPDLSGGTGPRSETGQAAEPAPRQAARRKKSSAGAASGG